MIAAYSLRWLPGGCWPPEVLRIPIVSAYVAARRMINMCEVYGACDREGRRELWRGRGRS